MASSAGAARLLMLLQVALLVVSAVLLSGSACHGARDVGLSSPMLTAFQPMDRSPHGQDGPPVVDLGAVWLRPQPATRWYGVPQKIRLLFGSRVNSPRHNESHAR
ncbi:hypothetical protein SEVIR_4G239601v4 [Setaria viridis]